MADVELAQKLARREAVIERGEIPEPRVSEVFNPYTEFSRKEIKEYEKQFKKFDVNEDQVLDFEELKRMMEILGAPQTHLTLKEMIKEVDEDFDGSISFREFLLIFKKARDGELNADDGLSALARLTSIDVDKAGVGGAKEFFEAKANELAKSSKFEEEIRQEQLERKKAEEERKARQAAFKEKANFFKSAATS